MNFAKVDHPGVTGVLKLDPRLVCSLYLNRNAGSSRETKAYNIEIKLFLFPFSYVMFMSYFYFCINWKIANKVAFVEQL